MAKRWKLSRRTSKKMFTRGASWTHIKNIGAMPMRGGYRL